MPEQSVATTFGPRGRNRTRRQQLRWLVHLGLLVTLVVSLLFETDPFIHIVVGLLFVALVGAHLWQRRRTSLGLVRRLAKVGHLYKRPARLALSDMVLTILTAAMVVSGFWDWIAGHPTKIRWHVITGVALTVYALVHTVRRRKRLRSSKVR
jgi:hypothetical protein